jgi:hypothetical protein
MKAFKHTFTSPSSVEREIKATRSGNARIHGMSSVTRASLAYIATQVRLHYIFGRTRLTQVLRYTSPCHQQASFLVQTQRRTPRRSTIVFWICWRIPRSKRRYRSYWRGGTSTCQTLRFQYIRNDISRQIFPSVSTAKRTLSANSTFAKIKSRRARLRKATFPSVQPE